MLDFIYIDLALVLLKERVKKALLLGRRRGAD